MAYNEYYDLYLLAQENPNALYYVVSFDTVDSKSLSRVKRQKLTANMFLIMKYVYDKLLEKEKELNREVVIKDERFFPPWDPRSASMINMAYMDPLIVGDSFHFTVLRDTVSKEEIIEWVEVCRKNLNMEEEFHIADGYYETNEYEKGSLKLYRAYCLQILENLHKPKTQKKLIKVKRIVDRNKITY